VGNRYVQSICVIFVTFSDSVSVFGLISLIMLLLWDSLDRWCVDIIVLSRYFKRARSQRGLCEQMCWRPLHSFTSYGLEWSNRIIRAAYKEVLITIIPGLTISRIVLQMWSQSFLWCRSIRIHRRIKKSMQTASL